MPPNLTLALGTGQTTVVDMARGFAVFANGGFRVTPYFVASINDASGAEVFKASPPLLARSARCPMAGDFGGGRRYLFRQRRASVHAGRATRLPMTMRREHPTLRPRPSRQPTKVSQLGVPGGATRAAGNQPANAYVMTDMMGDVIQRGTAQRALALGRKDLAGKTGTTSDRRDTWFVGFNADIAAADWMGFDQERSLGENEEGGRTALPMWIYFMEEALRGRPEHRLPEPPGVVRMWVSRDIRCADTSRRAGAIVRDVSRATCSTDRGSIDYSDEVGAET